jgi:hypothetical protein
VESPASRSDTDDTEAPATRTKRTTLATQTGRITGMPGLMLSGDAARCQAGTIWASDGPRIDLITFASPCDELFVTLAMHVCCTAASIGNCANAHDALTMW